MTERVAISVEGGVADVRLNRPDKMNALDPAMFDGIIEAIARLEKEPGLRAVVLSGEGRVFCAGLDMASFAGMAQGQGGNAAASGVRIEDRTHGQANRFQQVAWGWRTLPVPVIAAVHGVAFGGGFQIACGADVRITAPDTRHSVMEIKWGLIPDMAGIAIMRHLARDDVVRELCFSGRVFEGEEAQRIGFATRLSGDPHAEATALAREIAGKSPDAVRAAKRLLNGSRDADAETVLIAEAREQGALVGSPNQMEAAMAGLQKREPEFAEASA